MDKKNSKQKIVLAGGCFDILHAGHIEFLKKAKSLGTRLVILLESDENVKKLKGENRPVNKMQTRANNLFSTGFVDIIVPLPSKISDSYYKNVVKSTNPDIIAITNGDPLTDTKADYAESVGAELIAVVDRDPRYSTTSLVNKSKKLS